MYQDSSYTIEILFNRIAEGDERAFHILFDHHKERLYRAAFKMTQSADHAEEIVQEAFVSIWLKRKFVAAAENPEAYLYTIFQNCIYAHFRKVTQERRLRLKVEQEENMFEDSAETMLIQKEKRSILESVINQLPPQQKMVYQLAKQDGISREEIAERLNISPNTVRNHLAAAVGSLRAWIKANETALIWVALLWM